MIKQIPEDLPARYLAALESHLGHRRSRPAARSLGRLVLGAGLDTLALARMHEQALVTLAASHDFTDVRTGAMRRAGEFFTTALIPLERAHRATRESLALLRQRAATLRTHTSELAGSNRQLKREVARRRAGEHAVRLGRERYHLLWVRSQFMQKKLQHLARQFLAAQEDERRQISRELHDEVVQTLVGINVELAALGRSAALGAHALKSKIALTQRLVEKSVNAVHEFARELRPAVLDDLGLIPALQSYMKNLAARKNLKIHLTAFAGVEELDHTRRTVLYRVAQEALTNVGRHARASLVDVTVSAIPGAIRMEVRDNGRSFQVPQALSSKTNKRLGLLGMRERVEMVGGTLVIESAPGVGTTVRAEIPFSARGEA